MSRGDAEDLRLARIVDHVLGEGTADERAAWREQIAADLDLATEVGELRHLLERMRSIEVEPSGRVPRELRRIVQRRALRRAAPASSWPSRAWTAVRVAAVALVALGLGQVLFGEDGLVRRGLAGWHTEEQVGDAVVASPSARTRERGARNAADAELDLLLDPSRLPVDSPAFAESYRRLAERPFPDGFVALLSAENLIAHLRQESELRFSAAARAEARRLNGTPDLDARIAATAAQVAARVQRMLAAEPEGELRPLPGPDAVDGLSFAMRALLAAGSSLDHGEHAPTVRACRQALLEALPELPVERRSGVLAAIAELAMLGDRGSAAVLASAADELARDTLRTPADGRRPAMLSWLTPAQGLADAGRVLLVAPAFGTHAMLAFRARLMIAAHVAERLEARSGSEQPALVAAQLYGFGDLIDRREADRRLALWRGPSLLPDFVALHHAAWSQYPVRPGWAAFQRQLRQIAGVPTPDALSDASALLLTLCTNTAAPGVREGLGDAVL